MHLHKITLLALVFLIPQLSAAQHINVPLDDQRVAKIYTETIGQGEPVIIFHRASAGYLEPIFQKNPGWQRIYIDPPAVGNSSSDAWIYNADVALEVMLKTIEILIPGQQFAVAGFSYFGYMSMGVIKNMPGKVKGALLTCPVTIPQMNERNLAVSDYKLTDSAFYQALRPEEAALINGFVVQTEETYQVARHQRRNDVLLNVEFWNRIKENSYHFSFSTDSIIHQGPSLIFLGLQDPVVGYLDGLALARNFPRGSIVALDLASHSLPYEQNEIFSLLVSHWLERLKQE